LIDDLTLCPKCGQKLLEGAMKCMACGAVLKTEEEQKAMIQKFMEPRKRPFPWTGLLKVIVYMIVLGAVYYFFSEEIHTVIGYVTSD
jgi:uncharacterized membrane protein YvbJ